jgi:TolB-like protein/DNA-binding winged helix-turn-helix (wHTH) protein/Flp pilus assembly protein TadD
MRNSVREFYEFGPFCLDTQTHRLMRDGQLVPLYQKAVETLLLLVQNSGQILEREVLISAVWPDAFVEDANLTVAISQLRKALGQNGASTEYIETIPKVGYRFVAEVRERHEQARSLVIEKHSRARTVIEEEIFPEQRDEPQSVKENVAIPITSTLGSMIRRAANSSSRAVKLLFTLGVAVLGTSALLAYREFKPRTDPEVTSGSIRSVAVLPLKNLTGNPENEYLSDGLTDGLISALSRIEGLKVISRGSVIGLKGKEIDPREVGQRLGVATILEGSVIKSGDSARVSVLLLNAEDGRVLWASDGPEHSVTDVFAIQDELARDVISHVRPRIGAEGARQINRRGTHNAEAYQLYVKGRYFWNKRTPTELQQSLEFFRQAIDLDPTYAYAYAGMADAYALLVWQEQLPRNDFIARAKAAASKAIAIDETLAEPHATLGYVKFWWDWDFAGAESEFRRAIELNPAYATAHHWYGESLGLMGRFDDGLKELRLAQDVDPLSPIISADLGKLLFLARQPDQAIEQMQKALELDPDLPLAHVFLGLAYNKKGLHHQALAELEGVAQRPGARAIFRATLGFVYGEAGRKADAMAILDELRGPTWSKTYVSPFHMALVYVGLGENEKALDWLDRAETERDPFLIYIKVDPNFDNLRGDLRFTNLLRGIGFAD